MSFFHLGREAEDEEMFDPTPKLRELIGDAGMPREIELEEAADSPADKGEGEGEGEAAIILDMSAYRTLTGSGPASEVGAVVPNPAPAPVSGINPKDALGMKKPDLSLIPPAALLYEAQGMMDGGDKYGPYNWRTNPVRARIYIAAAMRHIGQYLDGEEFDPVSGVHHLGHARCCLGILCDAREVGNLVDDRPVKGPASDMIRRFNDAQSYDKES